MQCRNRKLATDTLTMQTLQVSCYIRQLNPFWIGFAKIYNSIQFLHYPLIPQTFSDMTKSMREHNVWSFSPCAAELTCMESTGMGAFKVHHLSTRWLRLSHNTYVQLWYSMKKNDTLSLWFQINPNGVIWPLLYKNKKNLKNSTPNPQRDMINVIWFPELYPTTVRGLLIKPTKCESSVWSWLNLSILVH